VACHRRRRPGARAHRQRCRTALQGKHKAVYTPHIDTGDHVVIVNAAKVRLTGRKEEQKLYRYHSGYEGGLREERAKDVRQKNRCAW
jgi:large subunit ribosomal protein L13